MKTKIVFGVLVVGAVFMVMGLISLMDGLHSIDLGRNMFYLSEKAGLNPDDFIDCNSVRCISLKEIHGAGMQQLLSGVLFMSVAWLIVFSAALWEVLTWKKKK